jgi:peptidyl-prolyl cis-trans isomerase SurA
MPGKSLTAVLIASALGAGSWLPVRGEVLESIVARVNDDIISQSELAEAERGVIDEIYSKNKGDALQKELARAKTELLRDLITKKLLIQQAERLYDITKMQDAFVRQFKEQQKIGSNADLERILHDEGMTLDEFKTRLIEINAPSSVVDLEVRDKISVSDAEVEKFYTDHQKDMASADTASYREIVLPVGDDREASLARAQALVVRARGGEDFTEIAKEASQVDPRVRGNVLGPFQKGELSPEIEAVVFAMKANDVSDPVVAGDAVHVIRVETRDESITPPLASVRDKIYDGLEARKFETALREYLESLWRNSDIHVADDYVARIPSELRKYLK